MMPFAAKLTFMFILFASASANAAISTVRYPGYDAPGCDFHNWTAGSSNRCATSCLEREDCIHAVFDIDDGSCWLKRCHTQIVPTPNSVLIFKYISGVAGVEFRGGTYLTMHTADWIGCSHQCYLQTGCAAVSFNKDTKECQMKNGTFREMRGTGNWTSGKR